jgi:hypothetical protein
MIRPPLLYYQLQYCNINDTQNHKKTEWTGEHRVIKVRVYTLRGGVSGANHVDPHPLL